MLIISFSILPITIAYTKLSVSNINILLINMYVIYHEHTTPRISGWHCWLWLLLVLRLLRLWLKPRDFDERIYNWRALIYFFIFSLCLMFLGYLVVPRGSRLSTASKTVYIGGFFFSFCKPCFLSIPQISLYATTHIFVPLMITVLTYFVVMHSSAITAVTNT